MKNRYVGINCSKCGRWVGSDGFHDYDPVTREIGYPLCGRCLAARGLTIYECQVELEEIGVPVSVCERERVVYLNETIKTRRKQYGWEDNADVSTA